MSDPQNSFAETSPAGAQQDAKSGFNDSLNEILARVVQTREARSLLADTVPIVLKAWAGDSAWRKMVSKAATDSLKKGFSAHTGSRDETIQTLFEDPAFITQVAEFMTGLLAGIEDALSTGTTTLERMPSDEKKKLATQNLLSLVQGKTGDIVTRCARMIAEIQQNDPVFLARILEPGFRKFLESVDFGELKIAVEGSAQGVGSLVEMVNDVMWQYPAKVILFLSLLPSFANILGRSVLVTAGKLEEIPPDLMADIVISLVKEIDGPMIAGLVNDFAEIARKLHTGSALLGEAGSPQLPKLFSEKLKVIVDRTDPVVFWKARIALADIKASFDRAIADAIDRNPEHRKQAILKSQELINIRRRTMNRKLSQFESMDDEELAELWTKRFAGYDVQETAEVLNNFLKLINRLWDQNPEAIPGIVSRFSSAIDDYELAETARRFFDDTGEDLLPAARSVIPSLVTWVCHVLKPEDDEYEEDAARAREALRSLLMSREE